MELNKELLLRELNDLNGNLDEKGNYIIDLGKHNKVGAQLIAAELKELFVDVDNYFWIRHASIMVLLMDLNIQDAGLLDFVKGLVNDSSQDSELITNCLSGIGVAYKDERDKDLVSFLHSYAKNTLNDISHRCSALISCLNVLGYSMMTIMKKSELSILSVYDLSWLKQVNLVFSNEIINFIGES